MLNMQDAMKAYATGGIFGGWHEPTEEESTGLLFAIFAFMRTTGKSGNRVLSRRTLLRGVTAEHKPDPKLNAQLILNQLLRDSEASSAREAAKLREQAEQRRKDEKANKVQIDPMDAMFAKFRKELNNA